MNAEDQSGAGDLVVVPAELQTAAQAIKNLLTNISSGWRSLDSDVTNLFTSWQGPAASSFADAWSELREGVGDLVDDIAGMESSLTRSAQAYLEQDGAGARAIESARSSLDL